MKKRKRRSKIWRFRKDASEMERRFRQYWFGHARDRNYQEKARNKMAADGRCGSLIEIQKKYCIMPVAMSGQEVHWYIAQLLDTKKTTGLSGLS